MSDSAHTLTCAFHAFIRGHVPRRGSQHRASDHLFVTPLGMRARQLMRAGLSRDDIAVRLIDELSAPDPEQQPEPEPQPEPDRARGITRFLTLLFWR